MIKEVRITNFKCFEDLPIDFGRLNILSGLNGMGKSSVVQAIMLVRQVFASGSYSSPDLPLKGDYVDLGRAKDVLYNAAKEDKFGISIVFSESKYEFDFLVNVEDNTVRVESEMLYDILLSNVDDTREAFFNAVGYSPPQTAAFNYLSAERFGPRKSLPTSSRSGFLFDLGRYGEFVFDGLIRHQDAISLRPDDPRYHSESVGQRLRDQIEAWLSEISPGVRLQIKDMQQADVAVGSYSFAREGALPTVDFRPTNVGFGLSYVLPVIAALLAAPKDGLVVVENPEAHLHPRGQTKMGELCAKAASAGVQVIIETHSDHVLDGCRIAIRDTEGLTDSRFHFFSQSFGRTIKSTPTIDENGRLSHWPDGFFDQHRWNAAKLARPVKA